MPYVWTDRFTGLQIDDLCDLYRNEWWTAARRADDVRRMLQHSDLIVAAVDDESRLAAFARVLTDRTYKALIFDVIVHPAHRARGLGRLLVEKVCAHPIVAAVCHVELYCRPELESFYAPLGFSPTAGTLRFLRREQRIEEPPCDRPRW